ncbi:trans-sulfuration enzyme family protein [Vagococcus fluvialis]|uniref:trans-sulfuration enzyme family protein n=1 Tax=Vagococcus fluvialis TaxID=2738 RepID=UPI001D0A213F|nr:PLP-dependent aspartate aminotransferase family protein [Vagococcus fluvialis]UDM70858.1 PLP-dependent aspartate aminotransferase family protein [Vagococcus fluvialis]UDM75714.1 PLP-dependent aspartate aminotransferase family protein [Vagococcus fluvialis]UDM82545.1 PLP-dependent aspartate aminotransferase family protein [Vagococcus fluvialis]
MNINTKLLHSYPVIDQKTGASSIPKYQASTFHQSDVFNHEGFNYTRFGNPTVEAAEKCVAMLEDAKHGLAFSSGMAAINSVLFLLSSGDHLVLGKNIYGGTFQTVTEFLERFGVEYTFVDESNINEWQEAVRENTKMFYLETPSNPLLTITDLKKVCDIAKKHQILTACDNTFMTPLEQSPLELGVDVVIHSATKFINGHSDIVAGFVVTNDDKLNETLKRHQKALGGVLSVEDAWLVLRGVKTMGLRMEKSIKNAKEIADFLKTKKQVKEIYYPGLETHTNYDIHMTQAKSGGAVLSFELETKEQVERLFNKCEVPIVAVSLGGVESILSYPWLMSHACMEESERLKMGVTPTLVRLSCGIEDVEDLINDLEQAIQ